MTANTCQSRKAKGRNLQKKIVEMILFAFPKLTHNDVRSTSMGVSGEDIILSEEAHRQFGFAVEAKNVEKINIWDCLTQSEDPKRKGIPLLCFKRNRSEIYCSLKFETLLKLITKDN